MLDGGRRAVCGLACSLHEKLLPLSAGCAPVTASSADMNVCTHCVRDKRFNEWIRENGQRGTCTFDASHGRARKVIPVGELARKVDEHFRATYRPADEEAYVTEDSDNVQYRAGGESYEEILMSELDCDEDV